ncbi:MAG: dihydrofolate reductase [Clostridiales Family XIII bacterium]|jgi:dihydrofolate reductase|nr:dihydrofolate reductase [Clostridiales Family XIII bacterium]
MKAIAAVDRNWGIGMDGGLLARLPSDMAYFREKTLGRTLIMGRKTLEGLPGGRPLAGRATLLLSRDPAYRADCEVFGSVEACLARVAGLGADEALVAGGAEIYRQFLPWCDECLITKIDAAFPADRHFENLDESAAFQLAWEGEALSENGLSYRFSAYRRLGLGPGRAAAEGGACAGEGPWQG